MFTKILYTVTDWFLKILRSRGVDISQLKGDGDREKQINNLERNLMYHQSCVSLKRSEIITEQNEIIRMMETPLFGILGKDDGNLNFERTTITKLYLDKIQRLNYKIQEHDYMIKDLEETFRKLENVKQ